MDSGAYCLLIYLKRKSRIKIGALGEINFEKGYYIYVGSAMKNLGKRVQRHLSKEKTIRWHIDYLLDDENAKIIHHICLPSETKEECNINQMVHTFPGALVTARKFGSSDCSICESHLHYFKINPKRLLKDIVNAGKL